MFKGRREIGEDRRMAARDLVSEALRTEEPGLEWRAGIAGSVATVGPLAIGLASGEAVLGLIAAIGALNTALCIPPAGLRVRLWWGSAAAVSSVAAFALANLVRDHEWAVVVATLLWVSAWAFARAAGRPGAILGFATSAVLVVVSGMPASRPTKARQKVKGKRQKFDSSLFSFLLRPTRLIARFALRDP